MAAMAFLLACSSPSLIDTGASSAHEGSPATLPSKADDCAEADDSTMSGAREWGDAQGYPELLGCCVTPPYAQCQFLLSRRPKRVVIAVCNGITGPRRCILNRTVTVPDR